MVKINNILKDTKLPSVYKVEQRFSNIKINNVEQYLWEQLLEQKLHIKKGSSVAITGGSRGISNYQLIMKTIVDFVKEQGATPFIVPAMGSHGGGSSTGQKEILENLGISEESIGCEIKSSMDVVEIGRTPKNLPVYIDKNAFEADGIILLNRVKPHTSFRGKYESGLVKMLAIGLGKRKGAEATHSLRFEEMAQNIYQSAKISIDKLNILCGVCTIENGYDEVSDVFVLNKEEILDIEPEILNKAKEKMPRIYLDNIDILIVKEIGKNISGTGMDTNIIGRFHTKAASGGPDIVKLGLLDITYKSSGNANGMGLADFATKKFLSKVDFKSTYLNAITSTEPNSIKLPMILDTDEYVFKACAKTCGVLDYSKIKLIVIENTKNLNSIYMSEEAYNSSQYKDKLKVISDKIEISFNNEGDLLL